MRWKPRKNFCLSQSKERIKHQSCFLKSLGYYGKSIKSVLKLLRAIRQPSTFSTDQPLPCNFTALSKAKCAQTAPTASWHDTLHVPLPTVLSCWWLNCCSHRITTHLASACDSRVATGLLLTETHSVYFLFWSNSQTCGRELIYNAHSDKQTAS